MAKEIWKNFQNGFLKLNKAMQEFLTFQLYGPMAAWGDIAVGEARPTSLHPSKSSIIGLVAASLGIPRSTKNNTHADEQAEQDLLNLAQNLGFAVCVGASGSPLRDYHTAQVPSSKKNQTFYTRRDELSEIKLNTILSSRDYRCDPFYRIVLWRRRDELSFSLQKIQKALAFPHFPLYLGRRSCPLSLPLNPEIIEAKNLLEIWGQISKKENSGIADILREQIRFESPVFLHWETLPRENPEDISGIPPQMTVLRRDIWASPKRRQFLTREEHKSPLPEEKDL